MRPHRQQPTRLPRPWDSPGKNTGVGCHFLLQFMNVKSESEVSCVRLFHMDFSLPGFSVHRIFQARVLEWGAIAFSGNVPLVQHNYLCVLVASKFLLWLKEKWRIWYVYFCKRWVVMREDDREMSENIWQVAFICMGFPGGTMIKNSPTNTGVARDVGSIPRWARSLGEGNCNPL